VSFIDAADESFSDVVEAKICIVGAGAAGITIADELSQDGSDILLIESGDRELDGETQALYRGSNTGYPYYDLASCRLRYFGGTTNHWGGYCRSNDPINYEGRPDLNIPKWPFGFEEAKPWLVRAAERLGIDDRFFEPSQLLRNAGIEPDDSLNRLDDKAFVAVNQITKSKRLGKNFAPEFEKSANLRVATNLNLVNVRLWDNGKAVKHLECKTLDGRRVRVEADVFVLACHAIENARLMLLSRDISSKGVGNDHDLVGRFFAEHPQIDAGLMVAGPRFREYFDRRSQRPETYLAAMSLAPEAMRESQSLSYHMHFSAERAHAGARRAARRLYDGLWKPYSSQMLRDAARVLGDITSLANPAPGPIHPNLDGSSDQVFRLNHTFEQAPNPDSRVRLSENEKDAFGLPRVELDWRLNEQDVRTLREGQRIISNELSAIGFGRFALEEFDFPMIEQRVRGHFHHYSTTRMDNDPRQGVVDSNQRVHGVENLFIAGSSVFPTAAAHGPTLHIIAFSLRLAEHLRDNLKRFQRSQ